ncbi:hypothetical protein GHK92_01415 [Nocardioides sp. dk4132]|uniref:SAV_915 family protein n=1 Tax=unclassified Nocardioides TaxID=2615069 RepID=UPI001295A960|nr:MULTISPECIES: SAV_915 family protein [unclassified Nocardioides]MQW74525.1 hypothetical protein [Nocardioides sp. dk4132]QGA06451.1 hypothetical protein GFH29_02860 [Nocardioides sp. dk884]
MNSSPRSVLLVPVHHAASGVATLVLARRPDGVRTGVAFASVAALERALGVGQPRLAMGLSALRGMLAEVGVHGVQVDPEAMARPASALPAVS